MEASDQLHVPAALSPATKILNVWSFAYTTHIQLHALLMHRIGRSIMLFEIS